MQALGVQVPNVEFVDNLNLGVLIVDPTPCVNIANEQERTQGTHTFWITLLVLVLAPFIINLFFHVLNQFLWNDQSWCSL
jgi:hypothetical protein